MTNRILGHLPALLGLLALGACSSSGSRSPDGSVGAGGSAQCAAAGSGQGGTGIGWSPFGDGRDCSGWAGSNPCILGFATGGTAGTPLATRGCSPPDCYATWTEVEASGGAYCALNNLEIWGTCDRYYFRTFCSTDFGSTSFYDKASGALTAIVGNTNGTYSCAAGAPGVPSPPDCPTDCEMIDPCVVRD